MGQRGKGLKCPNTPDIVEVALVVLARVATGVEDLGPREAGIVLGGAPVSHISKATNGALFQIHLIKLIFRGEVPVGIAGLT